MAVHIIRAKSSSKVNLTLEMVDVLHIIEVIEGMQGLTKNVMEREPSTEEQQRLADDVTADMERLKNKIASQLFNIEEEPKKQEVH